MELQGKIKTIGEIQTFGSNGFRKRELVVTTEEQYPQHILVEFVQDKCNILESYKPGESVKIGINLRGREWVNPKGETKYFNSIQGWRIDKIDSNNNDIPPPKEFEKTSDLNEDDFDDLPF